MREKLGALMQFLAVIIAFILMFWGIGGAYQAYFGNQDLATAKAVANAIVYLIYAVIGVGIGVGGVVVGNLLKK